MKKIGTLTFNRAINYGAVLQAFALKKKLEAYNEDVEVINYFQPHVESVYSCKGKRGFIRYLFFNRRNRKFRKFNKEISSEKIYDKESIKQANYDKIIVGSDQVWNYFCSGGDETFLLPNIRAKKYSYAASFGVGELSENQIGVFKENLSQFNYLSVREKTGQDICKNQLGLSADVVLDPTLLLIKEEWKECFNIKNNNKKYILVLAFDYNENLVALAKYISKLKGLPIYNISVKVKDFFGNKVIKNAGPKEWVDLFYNATYIVTDSFHATAFSINFNKQFYSFAINNKASRIVDLLNMLGISERLNPDLDNLDLSKEIDYRLVNEKLDEERKKSVAFIDKIMND